MRRYRKRKNWGQADLAAASGIKIDTIRTAEQGRHTPRRDTAERYDEALGAEGDVLRAFGYVTDELELSSPTRLDALEVEVRQLRQAVRELQEHVHPPATPAAPEGDEARSLPS